MRMNDNSRTPGRSGQLPVSKKFYADLSGRIENACRMSSAYGEALIETNAMIMVYLAEGKLPKRFRDPVAELIFNLLLPEIDRAIARSAAARKRARRAPRRKSAKAAATETDQKMKFQAGEDAQKTGFQRGEDAQESGAQPGEDADALKSVPTDGADAPMMTRRERRRIEQEKKRAGRRRPIPLGAKRQ